MIMALDKDGKLIEDFTSRLMPYISVEKNINATRMILVDKNGNPVNFNKTIKDSWDGSVDDTRSWPTTMSYFSIVNDGAERITVIIDDDITFIVDVGEDFSEDFDPFTSVQIVTTSPFRAYVKD
jgi:hypothetical protein